MDAERQPVISGRRRGLRCAPLAAFLLCFLLPFFSVTSCDGTEATVTGIQVVLGANPDVQPAEQRHGSPSAIDSELESEARSISQAARPWATGGLILAIVGIVLMVRVNRLHRVTSLAISAAALGAMVKMWGVAPLDAGAGLLLGSVVLLVTVVWQACALTFLAVRSALNPQMNPEWEGQSRKADDENSAGHPAQPGGGENLRTTQPR